MTDESAKAPAPPEPPRPTGESSGQRPAEPKKKGSDRPAEMETRWDRMKNNFRTILGAVLLAMFIRIVLFEAFEIEGPSMEPTLLNGDRVVVAKFMYGLFLPFTNEAVTTWGIPSPGDVVIVKSPQDNIDIVKRVVGLPGDVIEVREGVLRRNGQEIVHEELGRCRDALDRGETVDSEEDCEWVRETVGEHTYETSRSMSGHRMSTPPVTVPEGHIYILGDHRDRSNDSRFFGPVPVNRIKGRALFIYWSNANGVRWHRLFESVH